jgi:DNA-directed RNA polymerase subunit omega
MEIPQGLDSKFRFILVAARRAKELQAGARPRIQSAMKRWTLLALEEVSAGMVPIEITPLLPLARAK